jgi:hypothetical protein
MKPTILALVMVVSLLPMASALQATINFPDCSAAPSYSEVNSRVALVGCPTPGDGVKCGAIQFHNVVASPTSTFELRRTTDGLNCCENPINVGDTCVFTFTDSGDWVGAGGPMDTPPIEFTSTYAKQVCLTDTASCYSTGSSGFTMDPTNIYTGTYNAYLGIACVPGHNTWITSPLLNTQEFHSSSGSYQFNVPGSYGVEYSADYDCQLDAAGHCQGAETADDPAWDYGWGYIPRSDLITFRKTGSDSYSCDVQVVQPNRAPSVTVDVTPDPAYDDQNLVCKVVESSDPEGEQIKYTYKWYKDNAEQTGLRQEGTTSATSTVSSSYTSVGETWRCVVIPCDPYHCGNPDQDETVIIQDDTGCNGVWEGNDELEWVECDGTEEEANSHCSGGKVCGPPGSSRQCRCYMEPLIECDSGTLIWGQTDWVAGFGQDSWTDERKYLSDNGFVDVSQVGEVKMDETPTGGPVFDYDSGWIDAGTNMGENQPPGGDSYCEHSDFTCACCTGDGSYPKWGWDIIPGSCKPYSTIGREEGTLACGDSCFGCDAGASNSELQDYDVWHSFILTRCGGKTSGFGKYHVVPKAGDYYVSVDAQYDDSQGKEDMVVEINGKSQISYDPGNLGEGVWWSCYFPEPFSFNGDQDGVYFSGPPSESECDSVHLDAYRITKNIPPGIPPCYSSRPPVGVDPVGDDGVLISSVFDRLEGTSWGNIEWEGRNVGDVEVYFRAGGDSSLSNIPWQGPFTSAQSLPVSGRYGQYKLVLKGGGVVEEVRVCGLGTSTEGKDCSDGTTPTWSQSDWSGGEGQPDWVDKTKYDSDNGYVDVESIPGVLTWVYKDSGEYLGGGQGHCDSSNDYCLGELTSSIFDNKKLINWERVEWDGRPLDPKTYEVFELYVRAGNSPDLSDATWPVEPTIKLSYIGVIDITNKGIQGRYVQYKLLIKGDHYRISEPENYPGYSPPYISELKFCRRSVCGDNILDQPNSGNSYGSKWHLSAYGWVTQGVDPDDPNNFAWGFEQCDEPEGTPFEQSDCFNLLIRPYSIPEAERQMVTCDMKTVGEGDVGDLDLGILSGDDRKCVCRFPDGLYKAWPPDYSYYPPGLLADENFGIPLVTYIYGDPCLNQVNCEYVLHYEMCPGDFHDLLYKLPHDSNEDLLGDSCVSSVWTGTCEEVFDKDCHDALVESGCPALEGRNWEGIFADECQDNLVIGGGPDANVEYDRVYDWVIGYEMDHDFIQENLELGIYTWAPFMGRDNTGEPASNYDGHIVLGGATGTSCGDGEVQNSASPPDENSPLGPNSDGIEEDCDAVDALGWDQAGANAKCGVAGICYPPTDPDPNIRCTCLRSDGVCDGTRQDCATDPACCGDPMCPDFDNAENAYYNDICCFNTEDDDNDGTTDLADTDCCQFRGEFKGVWQQPYSPYTFDIEFLDGSVGPACSPLVEREWEFAIDGWDNLKCEAPDFRNQYGIGYPFIDLLFYDIRKEVGELTMGIASDSDGCCVTLTATSPAGDVVTQPYCLIEPIPITDLCPNCNVGDVPSIVRGVYKIRDHAVVARSDMKEAEERIDKLDTFCEDAGGCGSDSFPGGCLEISKLYLDAAKKFCNPKPTASCLDSTNAQKYAQEAKTWANEGLNVLCLEAGGDFNDCYY